MAWFLGQSLIVIIVAFLLGLLVGWLLWGRIRVTHRVPQQSTPAAPASPPQPAPAPQPVAAPQPVPAPRTELVHEVAHEQTRVTAPEPAVQQEPEPALQPVPDSRTPDDLQRIEGIGPKMAGALHAAGITTYAQLGASDEVAIRAAIAAARLRFAPSLPTWPRQAQLLADEDESGFTDLTRRLTGGRDTGRG